MTDTADVNLVLAAIRPRDALHHRALAHLAGQPRLLIPYSAGIELLLVARRLELGCFDALGAAEARFDLEGGPVLYLAAEALDSGEVRTGFDAVHLADAWTRRGRLHTADRELHRTSFATAPF